ncbi:MAG: hypothetical protein NC238_05265 [Dehalobacter sp.]|nr:hypothetical protein [Dehalobacter sp.]
MAEKAGLYARTKKPKQKCSNFRNKKPGYNSLAYPLTKYCNLNELQAIRLFRD